MINTRGSGILLPIFSLPGKYGIGSFSKEAFKFIDFLSDAGAKYWQILPLGPTSYGDSPYQSFSTFAMNPYFIDIDSLVSEGLLTAKEAYRLRPDNDATDERADYLWLYNTRLSGLKKAFERFDVTDSGYVSFCKQNEYWLHDYAFFMACKKANNDESFIEWPDLLRLRDAETIEKFEKLLSHEIGFYCFLQYEAYSQWMKLKKYANEKGIKIIGDIPIYVAFDSAEVWTRSVLFQMDKDGLPSAVAGCPPDGFSAEGQLWGNPLYDWGYHKETGYEWWIKRIEKCSELYDILRIDHFRGFDEYYAVPYGDKNAVNGKWCKGPGINLFTAIRSKFGEVDIIAEDLGYITDSVRKLVKDTEFPNMKVLEFAFDSRDSSGPSEYLPYNYGKNCVVYTGTHDNETLKGWLKSIQPAELKLVREYVGREKGSAEELTEELIRLAYASVANICIIPLQDHLGLGNEARMNRPSVLGGNWVWRMPCKCLNKALSKKIRKLAETYGRI